MEIEDFFSGYADALVTGDLDGVAACYGYPALILSDTGALAVGGEGDVKTAFGGAAERYRGQGLVKARPTIGEATWITERLVDVDVRWEYLDDEGNARGGERYLYTLRGTGTGGDLAIHVVVPIPAARAAEAGSGI